MSDDVAELKAEIERLKALNAALMREHGSSAISVELHVIPPATFKVVVTDPQGDQAREIKAAMTVYDRLHKLVKAMGAKGVKMGNVGFIP